MSSSGSSESVLRLPPWLKLQLPRGARGAEFSATTELLADLRLHTVCQSARCPNVFECFARRVATFLILGATCTRNCAFCNVTSGVVLPPDPDEPRRVCEAVGRLGLAHVVITSVTRDDLPDGGAGQFAAVLRQLGEAFPAVTSEVLTPDFQGSRKALARVLEQGPTVFNHNVETAAELYPRVRPQADYGRSLAVLRAAKELRPAVLVKSGLMVGLGESDAQVRAVVDDLAAAGCDVVTIGQYMRPSMAHAPVRRYVEPGGFEAYAAYGQALGLRMVCGPLVRSSYNAAAHVSA